MTGATSHFRHSMISWSEDWAESFALMSVWVIPIMSQSLYWPAKSIKITRCDAATRNAATQNYNPLME